MAAPLKKTKFRNLTSQCFKLAQNRCWAQISWSWVFRWLRLELTNIQTDRHTTFLNYICRFRVGFRKLLWGASIIFWVKLLNIPLIYSIHFSETNAFLFSFVILDILAKKNMFVWSTLWHLPILKGPLN